MTAKTLQVVKSIATTTVLRKNMIDVRIAFS